ncbi:hypothetical protein IGI04_013733, partial [Brassica rapa subsp. trilocularis]
MSLSHYCLRIESVQPRISPEVAVTSITRRSHSSFIAQEKKHDFSGLIARPDRFSKSLSTLRIPWIESAEPSEKIVSETQ